MELEEKTKSYSREEVLAIIKSQQATIEDYIVRTFFKLFKITDGPLFSQFERRFNNITFNNFAPISQFLTVALFKPTAAETLQREISSAKYFSCIYPNKLAENPPVLLQYFNTTTGLEQRLVGFTTLASLPEVLSEVGVIERVVGYCGDFCYRDPPSSNSGSDQIKSLRLLSGRSVIDLPYSDGFIDGLFNLLVSYFPENVVEGLEAIGSTMMGLTNDSRFAQDLVPQYKQWKSSGKHILGSDFADSIVNNYAAINTYMEPLHFLPRSIPSLLSSIFHRFLLVFIKEIYQEVARIELSDNNAVVYYFYLRKLGDVFEGYEDGHYIPPNAYRPISTATDASDDDLKIHHLLKEVVLEVDSTYARAAKYLKPLIKELETHFESCSWFLLAAPINPDELHQSYHTIKNTSSCESCRDLFEEVKIVNSLMPRIPLLDIVRVESKWLRVFKECDVPMIADLVEFLFSLPASWKVRDVEDGDSVQRMEAVIRDSMKNVALEDVVNGIEGFFGNRLRETEVHVEALKVPLFID